MPRYLFLFLLFLGTTLCGYAQQAKVTIVDALSGETLPGAYVLYTNNGKQKAVVTDVNGVATIAMAEESASKPITVRYMGYESVESTVEKGKQRIIKLPRDNKELREVVVTAGYNPQDPALAVHKVQVINKQQLERMGAVNLADALKVSLNIQQGVDPMLGTAIAMQGLSGNNVKILIDGVPVIGRLNGNIDVTQLPINQVERIEIVEGPLSVQYGTNALAGTINLITKKSADSFTKPVSGNLIGYVENIGHANIEGNVNVTKGNFYSRFNAGQNTFMGWNPGNDFMPNFFGGTPSDLNRRTLWNPRHQQFGGALIGYKKGKTDISFQTEIFDELVINRGAPRAPYGETAFDDRFFTNRFSNNLSVNTQLSKKVSYNGLIAYNQFDRIKETTRVDLLTLDRVLTQTPGDQDTSRFTLINARGSFIFGERSSILRGELGYDINHETALGARIDGLEQTMGDYALFATAEYIPFENLTIKPGVRVVHNTRYNAPLIPSVNIRYQVKNFVLRGSVAQGFRAPTLRELFFIFVDINHNIFGNQDLLAEKSINYQGSVQWQKVRKKNIFKTEVSAFYNRVSDLITLSMLDEVRYSFINAGDFNINGFVLAQQAKIDRLDLNVGFAFNQRTPILGEESTNFQRANWHEINGNANYYFPKLKLNAAFFYKYQGAMPIFTQTEAGEILERRTMGFHMLDATLTKTFLKDALNLTLGVKNLANVTNGIMGGTGGVHGGGGVMPIAMGRSVFIRANYNF
ncbi:MAG: TonB-dependent receptor [Luteibaculaceae bacterium]